MRVRSLVVVSAGLSQPSATRLLGQRLADATTTELRDLDIDASVEVIDLRDHAQDLTNNLLTGFPTPSLRTAVDAVHGTDGLIAVSPIFSASYSGLFKMFFDVLERDGLHGTPTLLAATGGTPRHSLALEHAMRPLFGYLGAATIPTAVFAAAEDWGSGERQTDDRLADRISRAGRELAIAMSHHEAPRAVDPFATPIPFERLLRGES